MRIHAHCAVLRWCLVALAVIAGPWTGGAAAQSESDLTLTGILLGPTRVAIIRAGDYTFIAKVGEPVGDAVVAAILPDKAVLKRGPRTFALPLQLAGPAPARPTASPNNALPLPVRAVHPGRALPARGARPSPGVAAPLPLPRVRPAAAPGPDMMVTGILSGTRRVAILQSRGGESFVAGAGDQVGDAVVVAVLPGKVILKRDGVLFELPLGRTAL